MIKISDKLVQISSLVLFFGICITTTMYYKLICSTGICSYVQITEIIIPLEMGTRILSLFFLSFIFLPSAYFKKWFKYIFSWAFPLSVYLVYATTNSHSIPAYGKDDVVRLLGWVFAVITVLFILYHYFKIRKQT